MPQFSSFKNGFKVGLKSKKSNSQQNDSRNFWRDFFINYQNYGFLAIWRIFHKSIQVWAHRSNLGCSSQGASVGFKNAYKYDICLRGCSPVEELVFSDSSWYGLLKHFGGIYSPLNIPLQWCFMIWAAFVTFDYFLNIN